jgi:hypothetical protein
MAAIYTRVGGVWKKLNKVHVRVGGVWKEVIRAYVRIGGVWKEIHSGVTPGSITYTTPGTYNFTVPNYNSLQVELWGSGGGGGAVSGTGGSNSPTYTNGSAGSAAKWDGGAASGKPEAGGGSGGIRPINNSISGGTASNGDINTPGNGRVDDNNYENYMPGANAPNGGTGGMYGNSTGTSGTDIPVASQATAPGAGGAANGQRISVSVPVGAGYMSYQTVSVWHMGGASGAYCKKTYSPGAYAVGSSVQVIVPSGGAGASGNPGARGEVKIVWS